MIKPFTGQPSEGMTYQSTRAGAKPPGSAGPFSAGELPPGCNLRLRAKPKRAPLLIVLWAVAFLVVGAVSFLLIDTVRLLRVVL